MKNILFHKDKPIIGIDIGQTSLKAMFLDPKNNTVLGYGSTNLNPQEIQKFFQEGGDYLADELEKLFGEKVIGKLPKTDAIISIPASRTFSRTFSVPLENESEIESAAWMEANQYIPIPSTSLYLDHEIIEKTDTDAVVLMSAVQQKIIDNIIESLKKVGVNPIAILPSVNAVSEVLKKTEEGYLPTVIIDIGQISTDIAILDGSIRITGSVGIGGNNFTTDIAKKLSITMENAYRLKITNGLTNGPKQQKITQALTPNFKKISTEVKKIIRYYNERLASGRKLEQVLIVGEGGNIPGIGDFFTNDLMMPTRPASPWMELNFGKLKTPEKQLKSRYITVSGLALIDPKEIWKK